MDPHHEKKVQRKENETGRFKFVRITVENECKHHGSKAQRSQKEGLRWATVVAPPLGMHSPDAIGQEIPSTEPESDGDSQQAIEILESG